MQIFSTESKTVYGNEYSVSVVYVEDGFSWADYEADLMARELELVYKTRRAKNIFEIATTI